MFVSDAIDIVIRDVRDRDCNTSKANKPISYNLRHFLDYTKWKHLLVIQ